MLNIVIPMAGAGSRFAKAGYSDPKPLIQVHDYPMIKLVINNLKPQCEHRFIFICQNQHVSDYGLNEKLRVWSNGGIVVGIDGLTEGAACTVLAAKDYINNGDPLMIANSDQFVDCDINHYLSLMGNDTDGIIMTMKANDPKWSFVGFDQDGVINNVVEKQVISDEATVGIYNFQRGSDFVSAAEDMIRSNARVNNEFYVAPVYNTIIKNGGKIRHYNIGSEGLGMYGLGIPADLELFLSNPVSDFAKVI
jgi:dTDP-glucose pyrophosphorylase